MAENDMNYQEFEIGMTGARMVDALNNNFNKTATQFLAQSQSILVRIISNDIKEMRIQNGIVQYTVDRRKLELITICLGTDIRKFICTV